ncbi:hypothetical protein ABPG74_010035 [Tetrahymena malaccensis]
MLSKQSTYQPDGRGRDMFIFKNNGGFIKVQKVFNCNITTSSFRDKEVKKYEGSPPQLKRVNYNLNGSGRDLFMRDGQVMVANQNMQKFNFLKQLRTYDSFQPFRTSYQLCNQRSRSESPLRSRKFICQEKQIRNFNPQYKNIDIDEKQPKHFKIRIEKFKQMQNDLHERIKSTNKLLNEADNNSPQKEVSSIKATHCVQQIKARFQSPLKIKQESDINPNIFETTRKLQFLQNHRILIL